MIDLRKKGLPNAIEVDGNSFLIKTDYRSWLQFGVLVENGCTYNDLSYLLEVDILSIDDLQEMFTKMQEFYNNPNSTPHTTSASTEKMLDYIEDGEYIYASFMQAYNIDLVDTDMHWHKFKALFSSLPENTKIASIMNYRSYEESKKSISEEYKALKRIWSFKKEVDEELIQEINELFYNS